MENIEQLFSRLHINKKCSTQIVPTFSNVSPQQPIEKFVRAAVIEINTLRQQNKQLLGQIDQLQKIISENPPGIPKIPFWVR